jgi:hypothetical protein
MNRHESRFEVVHEDKSFAVVTRVLRDRETGVCYLFHWEGYAGGLTALLNADGTVVVEPSTSSGSAV